MEKQTNKPEKAKNKIICDPSSTASYPHEIPFSDAVNLIFKFYYKFKFIPTTQGNIAPGWVDLSKNDALGTKLTHCGLLAYFCLLTQVVPEKYFLAFKTTTSLEDQDDAFPTTETDFLASTGSVNFPFGFDLAALTGFITTYSNRIIVDSQQQLVTDEVNLYAGDFFKKILNTDVGAMENPVGFFHYNQLDRLFNQTPPAGRTINFVRIYWGYEYQHANSAGIMRINNDKIKIVAFAVLDDGRNYCYINNDPNQGTAIILQHSWPPY